MMGNWGDDYERVEEKETKVKVRFMFSFKMMSIVINRISDETKEWDDNYPKKELLKILANIMAIFAFLFVFTYSFLVAATGIFFLFYVYALFQLYRAWKRFQYSGLVFWLYTIVGVAISFGVGQVLQKLILNV